MKPSNLRQRSKSIRVWEGTVIHLYLVCGGDKALNHTNISQHTHVADTYGRSFVSLFARPTSPPDFPLTAQSVGNTKPRGKDLTAWGNLGTLFLTFRLAGYPSEGAGGRWAVSTQGTCRRFHYWLHATRGGAGRGKKELCNY